MIYKAHTFMCLSAVAWAGECKGSFCVHGVSELETGWPNRNLTKLKIARGNASITLVIVF